MTDRPHVGFVLERALGHAAHADNLARMVPLETSIAGEVIALPFDVEGLPARIPVFNSNWTVRAGWRARRGIRRMHARRPLDALFIHTQVPSVLAVDLMRRIPTVVSLDATPLQYDELGEEYDHRTGNRHVERLKWRANRTSFERAAHIVTWSAWAKQGVVEGYGIDPAKITVIPPGVMLPEAPATRDRTGDGPVCILFVGGDLFRKGGRALLEAFAELRRELTDAPGGLDIELHLVTATALTPPTGVIVHHGLTPNAPELLRLYGEADVFCLPTRADTHAIVLSEAGAAGLPVVSTAVAGLPEVVEDGETGFLVPPDDVPALTRALAKVITDPELRRRLGAAGRSRVERHFDAQRNLERLVDLMRSVAAQGRG